MATKRAASEDVPSPKKKTVKVEEKETQPTSGNSSPAVVEGNKISRLEGHGHSKGFPYRVLVLTGVPLHWTKADVANHIKSASQSEEIYNGVQFIFMECEGNAFTGTCHVRFTSHEVCRHALMVLRLDKFRHNGKKIWYAKENKHNALIWLPNNKPDMKAIAAKYKSTQNFSQKQHHPPQEYYKPYYKKQRVQEWQENYDNYNYNYDNYQPTQEQDDGKIFQNNMILIKQNIDTADTYGLSKVFLDSLGLTTPLTVKVFVDNISNEYDDENELRKLFSHAGTVVSVAVIARVNDILKLKVEFDHPVEAVQAITMFNNQELYGKKLIVRMDYTHNAYKTFLPPGLKAFGPGLGFEGRAIKNVRNTIELQKAINMIMNEISTVKSQNHGGVEHDNANHRDNSQYQDNAQYQGNDQYQENQLQRNDQYQGNEYERAREYQADQFQANNQYNSNATPGPYYENQPSQPAVNHQPPNQPTPPQMNTSQPQMMAPNTAPANNAPAANVQDALATLASSLASPANPLLALGALLNPQASQMLQLLTQQTAGTNMLGAVAQTQDMAQAQLMQHIQMAQQMTPQPQMAPQMAPQPQMALQPQMAPQLQMNQAQVNPQAQSTSWSSNVSRDAKNIPGYSNNMAGPKNAPPAPNIKGKDVEIVRCSVAFSYLPPSVTSAALMTKMREIGEVRSVELTGPGRALVSFYSPRDADSCIKLLHNTRVDGQVIEARHM